MRICSLPLGPSRASGSCARSWLRTLMAWWSGEIQNELGIAASTLSHHLEKLKNEDLITVRRESTFLRYAANTATLEELLGFLYAECCTRNKAIKPGKITQICK